MKIPLPKKMKLGTIFIRIPPPLILLVVGIKIVRVIREAVVMSLTPPLGGGWKIKNNFNFALTAIMKLALTYGN
jgi:hypothetical protein